MKCVYASFYLDALMRRLASPSQMKPGSSRGRTKDQIPVRIFTPWDEQRPGFVEMDLVIHCGKHLDGSFLYTLTLTDLATGWTECLPLLSKRADTVLAALRQARILFPFPLLGIDTDSGSEFLNEELIGYCEQEHLTFTRGRSGRKNDRAHVEQKNKSVVREAVGCMRMEGERAYEHLSEVYWTLRLVVNYFQPSFKLQEIIPKGDREHRVYDSAQTPLQRLLASSILSEERRRELSAFVQRLDPLVLSEQLDILRHMLLGTTQVASAEERELAPTGFLSHDLRSEHAHEEDAQPPETAASAVARDAALVDPLSTPAPETANGTIEVEEQMAKKLTLTELEQAITAYLQEMSVTGRSLKTLQWHRTSLRSLRSSLWRQFHLTGEGELTSASLQTWLANLSLTPSVQSGKTRAMSTVAAYARSARAFCNWLIRNGYVTGALFPKASVPPVPRGVPQPVEPEVFLSLLRACELPGTPGGRNAGLTRRNCAILWLLLDAGLTVSELCALRLADVDRVNGSVMVRGKKENARTLSPPPNGLRAVCTYLDQVRLPSAWEPEGLQAQDRLLLTEQHQPLMKNSLTLLFVRLSQRAGLTGTPICPSMLRDTYAIRFLQAGGELAILQKQLGVVDRTSVRRYQCFCDGQRRAEAGAQKFSGQAIYISTASQAKQKHTSKDERTRVSQ